MSKEESFRVGINNLLRGSAELVSNLNIVAVGDRLYAKRNALIVQKGICSVFPEHARRKSLINVKPFEESRREPLRSNAPQRWLRTRFENRTLRSGEPSALEERCIGCEKRKLHCNSRGCTKEVGG